MPTIIQILEAAKMLPASTQCPVKCCRTSVRNAENNIPNIIEFNDILFANGNLHQQRKDVKKRRSLENVELFVLSILYWGFPTNQRGYCEHVYQNLDTIVGITKKILESKEFSKESYINDIYPVIQSCPNVSIAFFSKLFYFCDMTIEGKQCVILDSNVYDTIQSIEGEYAEKLRGAVNNYRYRPEAYPQYISIINTLSSDKVLPEDIEYTLFRW